MIELLQNLLQNIWAVYLDTAVWLLVGLIAAGLVKVYIPEDAMKRWLGGSGFFAVGRAALFGAPLPLCSCGVLPAAIGLHRAGASKEATVSFLISTPETSVDSVAVTYALMGPVMAVYRPVSALVSAIITGMMVAVMGGDGKKHTHLEMEQSSCCASGEEEASSCCSSAPVQKTMPRFLQAIKYAGADLLDDISRWMAFGIIFAGMMMTFIPEGWMAQWGQGITAMLVMLLIGIPLYICAVASTPVAAGLLIAGVSPGAVLVFLLVGPATNIAGIMLVKQELGLKVTWIYLTGISVVSIIMGLLLEKGIAAFNWQVVSSLSETHNFMPEALSLGSGILLLILALPGLRNKLMPFFVKD